MHKMATNRYQNWSGPSTVIVRSAPGGIKLGMNAGSPNKYVSRSIPGGMVRFSMPSGITLRAATRPRPNSAILRAHATERQMHD